MLLPCTSDSTFANFAASSRHTRAGAASKPDGPGVSSSRFRKVTDVSLSMMSETVRVAYDRWRATITTAVIGPSADFFQAAEKLQCA